MSNEVTPFTLPILPYDQNALEPHISSKTLSFHYGKHHLSYVKKLNGLVEGTDLGDLTLEEIVRETASKKDQVDVFNSAAQVWNHTFYWNSLRPNGGGKPTGTLAKAIDTAFGSVDAFIEKFTQAGTNQFGSGWAWLVKDGGAVKITSTPDAENPISRGQGTALLTIDVWEHAYYLDYQNRRKAYLKAVLEELINWEFAAQNWG